MNENQTYLVPESGEWWGKPWWEEKKWYGQTKYSLKEIRSAVGVLQHYFTADWAKQIRGNEIANVLLRNIYYGESAFQLLFLVSFSQNIQRMVHEPGFMSLLKRLKGIHDSDSALMEMSAGAAFKRNNYELEYPVPKSTKGKTPDIIAKGMDETLAIECKQLLSSIKSGWRELFYTELHHFIREEIEDGNHSCQLEFCDINIYPYFDKHGSPLHSSTEIARNYAGSACSSIKAQLMLMKHPDTFIVPDIVTGRLVSKSGGDIWSQWPELDDKKVFSRILANGIRRAAIQLNAVPYPGIAFIYHDQLPDYRYAHDVFNDVTRKDDLYNTIPAVILFQRQHCFVESKPYLLINESSSINYYDLNSSKVIDNVFMPYAQKY